jgi:hypothetical protein
MVECFVTGGHQKGGGIGECCGLPAMGKRWSARGHGYEATTFLYALLEES